MTIRTLPLARVAGALAQDGTLPVRLRALAAVVIFGMAPVPGVAQDTAEQASALLRASSTQSAIITFCAHHYEIDGTTALRIGKTARDVAAKVLGQAQSDTAFKEELARRYAEVKEQGEQQWCADQRAALAQTDTPVFKN